VRQCCPLSRRENSTCSAETLPMLGREQEAISGSLSCDTVKVRNGDTRRGTCRKTSSSLRICQSSRAHPKRRQAVTRWIPPQKARPAVDLSVRRCRGRRAEETVARLCTLSSASASASSSAAAVTAAEPYIMILDIAVVIAAFYRHDRIRRHIRRSEGERRL
jgi:hypothetical protein